MKTKIFTVLAALALVVLSTGVAQAADTKAGNAVYIAKEEIVSGNLYAAGETVTIDGTVGGDLIAIAQTITVNGRVEGDIIAAGQNIIINGGIGGNVRIAGNLLDINGAVARNVNAFGAKAVLGPDAHVGWDVYLAAGQVEVRGTVDGGVSGQAGQALVTGKIGKDLNLKLSNNGSQPALIVSSESIVNGDVIYTAQGPTNISPKASVAGKIQRQNLAEPKSNLLLLWLWRQLFAIFSALAVGLALIFITRNITDNILKRLAESPTQSILPGLILMFVLPPIALVLIFTLIGIPLALMVAAWWITMTYLAKIYAAIFVGQLILQKTTPQAKSSLFWSLLVGVLVCWLLFAIPYVGWLLALAATWLGLGGIWYYTAGQLRGHKLLN
ncbi:MAG: hypothetical protein WC453_04195 [Patescibacteria group bacterium]